jgi:hypothetical protein
MEFSTDIFKNISWRHTVSFFNMQLAYGLGYRKIVVVGMDHRYSQPEALAEGEIVSTDDDDGNHFDERYFRGLRWQAADVGAMERTYLLALDAFRSVGGEIVNATVGGNLELFPRLSLSDALRTG